VLLVGKTAETQQLDVVYRFYGNDITDSYLLADTLRISLAILASAAITH